jgi:molybdopterin-guanine dinucleotide biosynthesis protein A
MAGGESKRMGRDKATMIRHLSPNEPSGKSQTWLERQLRLLEGCGFEPQAVSWSRNQPPPPLPCGVTLIRDQAKTGGPLVGLEAVLTELPTPLVFIIAVDLQRMSPAVVTQIRAKARSGCGVVPITGDRPQPLSAIYPSSALPEIQRRLQRQEYSMRGLVGVGLAHGWLSPWLVPADCVQDFANWNQPSDLDS